MTDIPWSLILVVVLLLILAAELYAYFTGRTTLSRYVVALGATWPLLSFVIGLIVGGLATHFWLPWCPS
jgi:hypothetical protein